MNRLIRPFVIGALATFVFLAPASVAYALWSTTAAGSVTVTTSSPAPTLVTAPTVSCTGSGTSPTLTWTSVAGAARYRVFRGSVSGTPIKTVDAPATSVVLIQQDLGNPPEPSEKYPVVVTAANSFGESAPSNVFIIQFKRNGGCAG
jgi:hypothetical protein